MGAEKALTWKLLLNLVQKNLEKKKKPLPYALVKSSQVLQGFSKTRAVINVIEQFDKFKR